MISLLIIWAYAFSITSIYGMATCRLLGRVGKLEAGRLPLPLYSLVGIVSVSVILGYLSLFFKIGGLASGVILMGAIISLFLGRGFQRERVRAQLKIGMKIRLLVICVAAIIFVVILLKNATKYSDAFDTSLYHAQAIRWIEEFKATPGSANIHTRLAQNSSWFLSAALFSYKIVVFPLTRVHLAAGARFGFLGELIDAATYFHPINGLLFLLLVAYLSKGIARAIAGELRVSNLSKGIILFFACILFVRKYFSPIFSPEPDLAVTVLIWLVLLIFLQQVESGDVTFDHYSLAVVGLAAFAVTIKLSALPVLLIPAYLVITEFNAGRRRRAALVLGIVAVVLLPWLIRNVIVSGYLIYPILELDVFNFDWEIPAEMVVVDRKYILSWGRLPGLPPTGVLETPTSVWFPIWLASQSILHKVLLGFVLGLSTAYLIYGLVIVSRQGVKFVSGNAALAVLYASVYFGLLYWFMGSPDFRFGYGFMVFVVASLSAHLLKSVNLDKHVALVVLVFLLLHQGVTLYGELTNPNKIADHLVFPQGYSQEEVAAYTLDGQKFYYATNEKQACGYFPFPCAARQNDKLHLRGGSLSAGLKIHP
jgi:hypothetical protein